MRHETDETTADAGHYIDASHLAHARRHSAASLARMSPLELKLFLMRPDISTEETADALNEYAARLAALPVIS